MNVSSDGQPDEQLPEQFVEQMKLALEHLYDLPYLQRHRLSTNASDDIPLEEQAQQLRRDLLSAVEKLSPGPGVAFRAPQARLYQLMHLHYVEGLSVQETAHELGLSARQAYRDMRRGEESIAALLWNRYGPTSDREPRVREVSSIAAEMDRLEIHPQQVNLHTLLQNVHAAVSHLARQRGVAIRLEAENESLSVHADASATQQVLISMMSGAVQQANSGELLVAVGEQDEGIVITLSYSCAEGKAAELVAREATMHLLNRIGWRIKQEDCSNGVRRVTIYLESPGSVVLVIDDNEGLVELLQRYLSSHACRVMAATSGEQGLEMALGLDLRAIILDVMMPEMDGWEVLQMLQSNPKTAPVPVIICSVFNDPELAYSLGASLFLPKPVRRDDIVEAFTKLGVA